MLKILAVFVLCILGRVCFADTSSYQCVFLEEYQLEAGKLKLNKGSVAIGEHFSVNRKTGEAITPSSVIWPHSEAKVKVLAFGNEENSFISTYESKAKNNGAFIATLRIEEYSNGVNKPFVVLANYFVYTGYCK